MHNYEIVSRYCQDKILIYAGFLWKSRYYVAWKVELDFITKSLD